MATLSILNDPPKVLEGPQLLHELISWDENATSCALDFTKDDHRQQYTYRNFESCVKSLQSTILETLSKHVPNSDRQHVVPLLIPQSPGLYISQVAVLNSGGAFCPLILDSPIERLKFSVGDVQAKFVITTSRYQDQFSWKDGPEVILVDEFPQPQDVIQKTSNLPFKAQTDDLAYVMYTSGSSGTPKGVGVSHLAVTQSLLAHELFLPSFERFLQFAAPSFDVSVFEIFFPLKRGKTLVGCEKTQLMNDLPEMITRLGIDAAELTPGVAGSLLEKRAHAPGLKLLLTIGEMLTVPVVEEFGGSETQENMLYGMYGPTEAAIHCTVYPEMEADAKPGNIGVPFETVSTYIATPSTSPEDAANLTILPIGELGELVLGGPQLARGYLNREDQNKMAFIHFKGKNYYRTGDKARQLENGTIEILGRISSGQVKLRGQRLELGEVEEAAYKHLGVKTAVAAVINNSLVVYTLVRVKDIKESEIITTCAKWLPKYMLPNDVVILTDFPYMPSGKIDKKKLNSDYQQSKRLDEDQEAEGMSETQSLIKRILEEVLGTFRSTIRLASAGLDSLMAIRVASRLRASGFNVSTLSVLKAETLISLAQLCEDSKSITPSAQSSHTDTSVSDLLPALNGDAKDVESTMPCTPLQSAMLAETYLDQKAYRNWVELDLRNINDTEHVVSSLNLLAEHNPVLRTGFVDVAGAEGYQQVIWSDFKSYDIQEVEAFKYEFDPARDQSLHRPVRVQILRHESGVRVLLHIHHALYDAWSLELLLDDFNAILAGDSLSQRPSFRAVVDSYENGVLQDNNYAFGDYWKDHLEHVEFRQLPNFYPGERPTKGLAVVKLSTTILTSEIEAVARSLSVSPHTIFQAAHSLLLGSYLGTKDVCFGTVFSGRTLPVPGIEDIVGPCLATLPVRVDVSTIETLGQLVRELNSTSRKHLEYSTLPLRDIKSAAGAYPGQQLFDTLVIWQQTLHETGYEREYVSLVDTVDNLEFNLTLEITPGAENIELKANYQRALLPEKQVKAYLQQLEHVVRKIIKQPLIRLDSCFDGLDYTVSSIENEHPDTTIKPNTLSAPIEAIASSDPQRPAINFAHTINENNSDIEQVSYLELNTRGNQIGRYLMDENVLPDELVCICMDKCVDLYATILAVAKIGAGYLPQTPEVPADRLRLILEEAKVKIIVAHSSSRALLKQFSSVKVLYIDEINFGAFSTEKIASRSSPEHISHCVYTESEETLKGEIVTQGNLLSNLDVLEDLFPASHNARLLQQCSQALDASVFEIFYTWRIGGCLCSSAKDVLSRDLELAIRSLNITHLSMTPSVAFLVDPKNVPSVEFLVTAGEAVTEKVKSAWQDRGLWQGYGSRETTNICTVKSRVTAADAINNIGLPLRNTSAFVLSPGPDFSVVPLGGEGELVFGGAQVFRGYVDQSKDVGKIIEHPKFGRLYRSGDYGIMLSDGSLSFAGRKDDQVKTQIRGQRVEFGEIDSIMLSSDVVKDCITMVIDGSNNEQRLVCFWAVSGEVSSEVKILKPDQTILSNLYRSLESSLPAYMVPSSLISISSLPATAQGKVDKQYLTKAFHELDVECLDLVSQGPASAETRTLTPLEKKIAEAVAVVAKVEAGQVGANTSFFNLGIDSISAISLSKRLRQTLEKNVEISDILKSLSVARLANRISSLEEENSHDSQIPTQQDFDFDEAFQEATKKRFLDVGKTVRSIYPCTPLQEAMLSASQSSSLAYDNRVTFNVSGDVEKLRGCWRRMVERHEILRTCFISTDMPRFPFVQVVLEKHELASAHDTKPSELEPPYSIEWIHSEGSQKLVVAMHHTLYDGVALAVLYEEIEMLYKGASLSPAISFESFLKTIFSQDTTLADRFWRSNLQDLHATRFSQLSENPVIDQPQSRQSFGKAGKSLSWIEDNCKKHSTSLLAVVHTVWAAILGELHQESDICFGNVVSGRTVAIEGIERLVAPCFNTIPVRSSQTDQLSYLEAFRKFQNLNANSLPFQLTPLRRIQSKFSPDGSRLFDTLLILQQPPRPLDSSIWSITDDTGAMDFPLVCEVVPNHSDDTLDIILHSYVSYFTDSDVENILSLIQSNIEQALENPRRQLLSATLKEQIIAKADERSSKEQISQKAQKETKPMSKEELELRDTIAQFTDMGSDKITRDVSIFRLGLDSISVVQVAARLRKQGHNVTAGDILERPTIAQLSVFLAGNSKAATAIESHDFQGFDNKHRDTVCAKYNLRTEDIEAVRPCTFVQQGMLAVTLSSGANEYVNSFWLKIQSDASTADLRSAWKTVCEAHEMLRTGFVSIDDPKYSFAMVTYRKENYDLPWKETNEATDKACDSQSLLHESWSLALSKDDDARILQFQAHHALFDAQSIQLILTDVAKALAGQGIPTRPSVDVLLGAILQSSEQEQQEKEAFWRRAENKIVVNRFPDLTPLQISETTSLVHEITSRSEISKLEAHCRDSGVTMQTATQIAWARLLTAYIGETSTTFGMTLSGRSVHEEGDQILFPSIVTVPVRCDISGTNGQLLTRTMDYNAALHKHQFTPLTSIQKLAGYPEGKIFDTLFAYQKLPESEDEVVRPWSVVKEEASVDYAVSMEVQPASSGEIILRLTFRQDVIPAEHADMILQQYDALLRDTLENPQNSCDISSLNNQELMSITPALESVLPGPVKLLHEFVTLQAQQQPDKIALEFATNLEPGQFESQKWTYRELDQESNKVANFLIKFGVIPGEMIAICFDKCAEASFAIIGVMRAGCSYVALDPSAPNERSKFIVEDSAAKMILSRGKPAECLRSYMEKDIIAFDSAQVLEGCSSDSPVLARDITPEDTSYCLYTSGTTGTPKGCLITHDNTVQFMLAFSRLFDGHWTEDSKYLQFASFHFDVSVMEQFWSWSVGICVASAPRDLIFEDIPGAINMLGITHIDLTPSLARLVHPDTVPSLCKGGFVTGGEQLKQEILDVWGEHAVIYNAYGPTEATIGCTMYPRVPKNGKPSNIGPAYVNVGSFVLKPGTELPVLRGGIGELCVSGKLVGKGYLNRADLTAERFPTLKEFGERVYRTGDLVRILHDGSFIFLGRADDQVKLRGQRLELSEINQVIKKSMDDVQEVVTLVLKHAAQQKEQLVTFFVLETGLEAAEDGGVIATMREACKAKLPGYMVPTHFIPVKAIPLSANNKADAKQLGALYNDTSVDQLQKLSQSNQTEKPWSENEKTIVRLIATALRTELESVTRGSNIFELGLDSISMIGFSRTLQDAGLENAKLSIVKSNPSIGSLVQALMSREAPDQGKKNAHIAASQSIAAFAQRHIVGVCTELGIESADVEAVVPCTPVQEGMIYRFLVSEQALYFNKFEFELKDGVDTEKLLAAWRKVIERLEVLRTSFVATDDGFAQVVLKSGRQQHVEKKTNYDTVDKSLALKLPYSFTVIPKDGGKFATLRIFHGLYDGNSLTMMLHCLIEEYKEHENVEYGPSFIASLPYGPLAKVPGAEDFWKEHLKNWTEQSIPQSAESNKDVVSKLSIENLAGFEDARKKLSVTPQAIVQAVWISVLQNIISNPTIGIVTSGRAIDYEDAAKIIGPLFNTIPFNVQIQSGTMSTLIKQCHDYNMQMQDFQHTPLKNVQKWGPSKPGQQLFDTLFVFKRPEVEDEDFAKGVWTQIEDDQVADYPLAFEATLSPDSTKLELLIVAQGSVMTEDQSARLLQQVKASLLTTIESAGQNTIVGSEATTNGTKDKTSEATPDTASEPFAWTEKTKNIKDEISKLANVSEDSVGENSSIFELGLDSIDVIKLASRLKKRGIEIPVSAIIRSQTIAKMAAYISSDASAASTATGKSLSDMSSQIKTYLESTGKLPEDIEDVLPATPLQQSMVNEMIKSDYERYFNVDGFKLTNGVDLEKLIAAVMQVVEQSPILRTTFMEIDDPKLSVSYAQIMHKRLPQFDGATMISTLPQGQSVESAIEHFKHVAISYASQRKQLLQLQAVHAENDDYLFIAISHALYDGTSLRSIHEDIQRAYNGTLLPRPDFMPFLQEVFQSTTDDAKRFWRTTLSDLPSAKFPTKESSTSGEKNESTRLERQSRVSLSDIETLCKASRITLQTLGQTCWTIVLSHLMGQLDVVFGSVLSCRDSEDAASVSFPLMNTVAVRSVLHDSIDEMLKYMQEISDMTRQYQHFPLGTAQAYALASRRDRGVSSDTTLFDTLFIYQGKRNTQAAGDLLYESVYGVADVEFPVCIEMEILDDKHLCWTTKCKSSARDAKETEGILEALEAVLEHIISDSRAQTMVSGNNGVSVCGLPPIQIAEIQPKKATSKMNINADVKWTEMELNIRKALHQISDVAEDSIGKETTIFHLGLDSILILKLPALLKTYGIKLSVSSILKDQTIAAMALTAGGSNSATETEKEVDIDAVIKESMRDIDIESEIQELEKEGGKVEYVMPATAGQTYMIRQWQASHGTMFYQTFTYALSSSLDETALENAWKTLLSRHEILRTGFVEAGDKILQVIYQDPENDIVYGTSTTRKQRGDLKLPPVNLVVEEKEGGKTMVKLVLHHVLYDGISLPILISDLQSLYHSFSTQTANQSSAPQTDSFKHFVAHSTVASSSTADEWINYLAEYAETLFPIRQADNAKKTSKSRTEIYHPSNPTSDLKARAQEAGVSIDALFLTGIAKILASSHNSPREHVIFGIYLSNRAPFASDLSSLSFPTLNLLPLRVKDPVSRDVEEIAKDVQRDLNIIGDKGMVSASLAQIYEWTGIRVDCFVNILKSAGDSPGQVTQTTTEWEAIQDLSRKGDIVEAEVNGNLQEIGEEEKKLKAYLPTVDIELRYTGTPGAEKGRGSVDMGVFAPVDKLDISGAENLMVQFLDLWR